MSRLPFDCARTCRTMERRDLCRFMPLLAHLGAAGPVTSHTTTVKIELRSMPALASAVAQLGGTMLGEGRHQLYRTNSEQGLGFSLPGWTYPLVLRADGQLAYDAYRGEPADVARLMRAYVIAAAREAAAGNGWQIESDTPDALVIAHPAGGKLTVNADGTCDASGFCGNDCHATAPIEAALGQVEGRSFKPEYYEGAGQLRMQRQR